MEEQEYTIKILGTGTITDLKEAILDTLKKIIETECFYEDGITQVELDEIKRKRN